MKEIWKNGVVVLLVIAVLYIIFLRECKKPDPGPAKDEIIIKKSDWQSMIDAANKPATHDTIWLKGDIVYVPTTPDNPLPDPQPEPNNSTNTYADSLVNKEIYVHYDFKIKGTLLSRNWSYRPIIEIRTDSIPYPVYVKGDPYEVKISQRGLYIYGSAGGNDKSFLFGGGLDFITKKNTEIGYMYQRFGNQNFHNIKVGIKLFR
jgi:hypothetical protein